MHQMSRLDHQVLHAVCHSALQRLIHVVNILSVARLYMVDDDLRGKRSSHGPVRERFLQGIFYRFDILYTAVVKGSTKAYNQELILADFILIARIIQRGVPSISSKIIRICIFSGYQFFLSIRQRVPCGFCFFALRVCLIGSLLYINRVNESSYIICRCLIRILFALCGFCILCCSSVFCAFCGIFCRSRLCRLRSLLRLTAASCQTRCRYQKNCQ